MIILKNLFLGVALLGTLSVSAQEVPMNQSQDMGMQEPMGMAEQPGTPQKAYPPQYNIPASDRMFSKRIWRMIDLREKQNRPLFSKDRWISRVIIDAVKRGELPVYKNDSLTSTLTREEFVKNLTIPAAGGGLSEEEKAAGLTDDWGGGGDWGDDGGDQAAVAIAQEYFPQELYTMELVEDVVFDKKRSRMYNQIEAITLFVPADLSTNARNILMPLGTFKYSDLVKVFHSDPNAVWFNPQNDAQHKNMAEAFELRLFNSYIVKVSNPVGDRLDGAGKQGLYASQRVQEDIIEFEYSLWSY